METKKQKEAVETASAPESVYTARELADSCHVFGTMKDIVLMALRRAGKPVTTFSDARQIIDEFKNKEV